MSWRTIFASTSQGLFFPTLPTGVVTGAGSAASATWKVLITPIGTCKTILQTDGERGWAILREKIRQRGPLILWSGWEGDYLANMVASYPYWAAMNFLQKTVPQVKEGALKKLIRNALIGALSSSTSDVISNSIRVVTAKKATHENANVSYLEAAKETLAQDGPRGLFLRGLDSRLLANIMQSAFFVVLWKYLSGQA
eukprot:TRINITY_DN36215_c0_g1_i1.p2 TRINITY_DN36215_c0_g1~~TRINITY_DN36215_c0_g1_i1.p2  ORF type:complete len:197 (-),score=28.88 TRINITY_DN36215_c0_g1_i1:164-754(-)